MTGRMVGWKVGAGGLKDNHISPPGAPRPDGGTIHTVDERENGSDTASHTATSNTYLPLSVSVNWTKQG